MPRRKGWDFAQLSSTFPGDPEFVRLSRRAPDDRCYLAAVGLWAILLADAWHSDNPDVADVLTGFEDPELTTLLEKAGLVRDGHIVGFEKWTAAVRRDREEDAARKRGLRQTPPDSTGRKGTHKDSPRGVEVGVGEEVRSKGSPKRGTASAREPLLTKAQLDDWRTFGREWDGFKAAWLARGFMFPPSGTAEDDDNSQRGLLWSVLDSRPSDLPGWIADAPGKTATEVIGYVLRRWHTIRDEADPTTPHLGTHGPSRRQPPEHVASILERVR